MEDVAHFHSHPKTDEKIYGQRLEIGNTPMPTDFYDDKNGWKLCGTLLGGVELQPDFDVIVIRPRIFTVEFPQTL